MKSVLIVTPYFAPQSHAAVFRAHKLAKYLPEHGWKPYVLTVDANYLYNEDPGLLEELPEEVEIHRTRYIEPSARGLRMALGGRDRTFVAEKAGLLERQWAGGRPADVAPAPTLPRVLAGKLYGHARKAWLQSPDAYWTWERTAIPAGRELIERHGIDVVYTTALPLTSHRIGIALQAHGVRWVADFRDPATYGARFSSENSRVLAAQRAIVEATLRQADAVTTLSSTYALIFHDLFGDITRQPIRFIPTGVDDRLIDYAVAAPPPDGVAGSPYLIYVGEVMPDYGAQFFQSFAQARASSGSRTGIKVIGHELLNRKRLLAVIHDNELEGAVEFIDHLPQRELYRYIRHARAAILAPGPTSHWWTNHAKLVDYVGLRKPVLAVVPDPSEARSVLTKTNLGILLDGGPTEARLTLTAFLNGDLVIPDPVDVECERHLASSQVASFADVFYAVSGRSSSSEHAVYRG